MKMKKVKHFKPVEILKEDHQKVKVLFEEFESAKKASHKEEIVAKAIRELKSHASVEEEIFYPAARKKLKSAEGEDLMNEAMEEHHVVKLLIKELEGMSASDERYDAKFTVLSENVEHHIREEEGDLFPKITKSQANSGEIGEQMLRRKRALEEDGNFSKEKSKKDRPELTAHAA